MTNIDSS